MTGLVGVCSDSRSLMKFLAREARSSAGDPAAIGIDEAEWRRPGCAGSDVALYYTMKTLGLKPRDFGPPLILTLRPIPLLLGKLDTHLSPEKFAANLVGFAEQHRGDSPEAITAHVENYLTKFNENVGFVRDPR